MKTEKLIRSVFASESSGKTTGIIALVAGLAAGAVLGVLFAPESGEAARNKLKEAAGKLFGGNSRDQQEPEETQNDRHALNKKPKSDIKSLIHQAHVQAANADQDAQ